MQYYPRLLESVILSQMKNDSRIIMLFGARQTGKTTLTRAILSRADNRDLLEVSGEDPAVSELLSSCNLSRMEGLFAGYRVVLIDEAQHVPSIGRALKLLYDTDRTGSPQRQIIVTGSSSLSLAKGTREALTGRTWSYTLYPLSFAELIQQENAFFLHQRLPEALVLGLYPALFSIPNRTDRIHHLHELSSAYLYRDVLELGAIRNPDKLRTLLRLLAFQLGSEVSYQELGRQCGMSADTVISYIDLLEKSFVVFRMGAFSRNLRKEISKKDKVYFYDNGIRNALIQDTREWHLRNDQGALWENFLVSERVKINSYSRRYCSSYFWRTHTGAEIDYIEEADGAISAFDFKLQQQKRSAPRSFLDAYPGADYRVVSMDDYLDFVTSP